MIENIKNNIIAENHELRARLNTVEADNEILKDKRIDELINALVEQDKNEELEEKVKKLEIKNQQLREVIKELVNGKKKL